MTAPAEDPAKFHTAQARRAARLLEFPAVLALVARHCATPRARAELLALVPSTQADELEALWAHVSELMRFHQDGDALPLGEIIELHEAIGAQRPHAGPLDAPQLAAVGSACHTLDAFREAVLTHAARLPLSASRLLGSQSARALGDHLAAALETDGRIKDAASPKLAGLRRAVVAATASVREVARREMAHALAQGWTSGPELVLRGERHCIPLQSRHRRQLAGVVHDRSDTGATLFIEPLRVVEAANDLQEARLSVYDEERRIIAALNQAVSDQAPALLDLYDRVVALDTVRARALWGALHQAWAPQFHPAGVEVISLRGFRHPLLRAGLAAQNRERELVPLDLELRAQDRVVLISGPNAGGKTVAMKAMGLAVLMAQSGIPLPARAAPRLPVFGSVLMDLGDEQSIADALSSFSAHLTHLRAILNEADSRSLVLLDEAGGGTDPEEGIALARAVLEALAARGATTLATTHYGQLKAVVEQMPGFRNASMAYDAEQLRPCFALVLDVPGSSHALAIAQRIGLPDAVLERARALVGDATLKLDALLLEAERQRAALAAARTQAEESRASAEASRQRYDEMARELKQTRRQRLDEAQRQAEGIVRGARARIERLLAQMRAAGMPAGDSPAPAAELKATPPVSGAPDAEPLLLAAEQARAAVDQIAAQLSRELEGRAARQRPPRRSPPRVGETVIHRALGKPGRVLEVRGERVTLSIDGHRVVAGAPDLADADPDRGQDAPPPPGHVRTELTAGAASAQGELDVRGKDVLEAWEAVDRELDRCLVTGVATLTVIHGKGTGALRRGLAERLRRDPRVRSATVGGDAGGDDGFTEIQL